MSPIEFDLLYHFIPFVNFCKEKIFSYSQKRGLPYRLFLFTVLKLPYRQFGRKFFRNLLSREV